MTNANKIQIALLAFIMLISIINGCNSCSHSKRIDALSASVDTARAVASKQQAANARLFEVQLQTVKPEVMNEIMRYYNRQEDRSLIQLNEQYIKNLNLQIQQLKNTTMRDTASKKNR